MQRIDPIQFENTLAQKMLEESVSNPTIKQVLKEIAAILIQSVLKPLQDQLSNVTDFSQLNLETQKLLQNLAAEHSAEERQYGALLPEFLSAKTITDSITNLHWLLFAQENALRAIDEIKTIDEMAIVLKIIVELGFTYYEAPNSYHSKDFETIKNMISPTTEELDIRLFRAEIGESAKLALTFGIGTDDNDLGLKTENKGRNAGKAAFGAVSMKKRLTFLYEAYDKTKDQKYVTKLNYYQMPLEIATDQKDKMIEAYANKWKTFFEKLIEDPKTKTSLPLIASVSRATARVLVSLQDLCAFNKADGSFDFDKAQIIANCLMGFIVHAGHHSIVEVAEVYNRLLDYIAIENLERTGKPHPDLLEKKMPYHRVGNYHSFFNINYADQMTSSNCASPSRNII